MNEIVPNSQESGVEGITGVAKIKRGSMTAQSEKAMTKITIVR